MSLASSIAGVVITGHGVVDRADLEDGLARLPEHVRSRALRAERVTQLALVGADRALRAAGLACERARPEAAVGVVLGTAFGCFLTNESHQRRLADGGPAAVSPRTFAATVSNAATGEITIAYGLGGPAVTFSAGLVSGLAALAEGRAWLARGDVAALLVGAADAWGPALARWIDDAGLTRAVVPGEGAAFVVLERANDAQRRGATVHAVLEAAALGFGAGVEEVEALLARFGHERRPATLPLPGLSERALAALLQRIESTGPGTVLCAYDTCPTGHVAGVALRRGVA